MKKINIGLVLAASLAACGGNPSAPAQAGPVVLTAQINRSEITQGGTAVVSFRLENTTSSAVTLTFGSGCQVQPFIARRPSNEVIYPSGGGWLCTAALTQLSLPPLGVSVSEVSVVAGDRTPTHVGLGPGEYSFFARIDSSEHKLESPRVSLTVR